MTTAQPEARILGKLLALQQAIEFLSTAEEQTVCMRRTLQEIPGLADVRFCLFDLWVPECPYSNTTCVLADQLGSPGLASSPPCCSQGALKVRSMPVRTAAKRYGFMILSIADPLTLAPYVPYLANTASSLANQMEKRSLRTEIQQLRHALEPQIQARPGNSQASRSETWIRGSEAFIQPLLDNIFAFVGVLRPDGTLIQVNRAPLQAAGIRLEEVYGKKFWDCYWWNYSPNVQQRLMTAVEQVARGKISRYDVDIRMAGDEFISIDFLLSPLRDDTGEITHLIPSAIPITERKHMEQALRDADRRKDEFLAMLAHELRNPLAPIRNAGQVLRIKAKHLPDFQRPIEIIERQVNHLAKLVDDLLDVSRITRGKINLLKSPINLTTIVHRAVELNQPLIEARRQRLIVTGSRHELIVDGDEVRLVQVLSNLIHNAAKYSENGGRIELRIEQDGNAAILRVCDTGMGISPEVLPHIFDLFHQGERSLDRAHGGLGIGLSLVKSLVEMHGGQVEAYSDGPGQGSEFLVRLPLLIPAAGPAFPSDSARPLRKSVSKSEHADHD